jgi:hypothetical protein
MLLRCGKKATRTDDDWRKARMVAEEAGGRPDHVEAGRTWKSVWILFQVR